MSAVICIRTRSTVSPFGATPAPSAPGSSDTPQLATAGATTRLRLTRRGRIVFTTLAAAPLVVMALVLAVNGGVASASNAVAASGAAAFDYVTISAGESLWDIAESFAPSSDPRDVIADIVSLNQLASEDVEPGQRLALPLSQ